LILQLPRKRVEISDFNEGLLQSVDGPSIIGNVVKKEEKDANMPFMIKSTFDVEVGKVKKIVELKHEVLKVIGVCLK
jgi:hypothetical protein